MTDGSGTAGIDVTLAATIAAGDVVVATSTDANGNTSEMTPRIVFSVDPISGPSAGGTAVTVKGTEFEDGLTLTIGGQPAGSVVVPDGHTITATSPALGPGTASDIVVTDPSGITGTLIKGFLVDFLDVPPFQQFYSYVTTLVQNGITVGVGGGNTAWISRRCASRWPCSSSRPSTASASRLRLVGIFADVPCSSKLRRGGSRRWRTRASPEAAAEATIARPIPCARDQMAVFLLKGERGFELFASFVRGHLRRRGLPVHLRRLDRAAVGRGDHGRLRRRQLLPAERRTPRGQMAVFLVKTFRLAITAVGAPSPRSSAVPVSSSPSRRSVDPPGFEPSRRTKSSISA